jgi:pyruvate dehydrogenase E2 component (dihydrolipoamide acetyltransferase)
MAQIIGLPKLSPTMEEGVLVKWTKKEGDKVSPGDLVAEVETDKANMDFNIEDDGVLLKLLVAEGDTVKLGAPVAIIGKAGEDVSALVEEAKRTSEQGPRTSDLGPRTAAPEPRAEQPKAPPAHGPETSTTAPAAKKPTPAQARPEARGPRPEAPPAKAPPAKLLASPLAKTLAIELGIDLRTIQGSGPGGRIVERDVRAAAEGGGGNGHATAPRREAAEAAAELPAEPEPEDEAQATQALAVRHPRQMRPDAEGDWEDVRASNMRKRIAARLSEVQREVPSFYLMRQIDAAPLLAFRARLNDLLGDKGKVSVNDLVIKAVALALRRVPACNASWEGDALRRHHRVHIGVAVAIPDGLVTPVIRDADQKGLGSIAAEVRDLAERARTRQLKGHEITGSTFSVSNLGMYGIERFTAIINPPEAGILAIGGVIDTPVVQGNQLVAGKRMTVTMTCDHRVIDGALGAQWLGAFVELIEHPESLAL